ncbi:MAG TPA: hypothetical protein VIJ25_15690, partial [Methylococcales bacterium]
APADTADGFAEQLVDVVTDILDAFAPLQTFKRRPSKPITKWLSAEAVAAKRERRKFERVWRGSGQDADRIAYRKACRSTNALINNSRRDFFKAQLTGAEADPRRRWRIVRHLLHSSETNRTQTAAECFKLCQTLSYFFH